MYSLATNYREFAEALLADSVTRFPVCHCEAKPKQSRGRFDALQSLRSVHRQTMNHEQ